MVWRSRRATSDLHTRTVRGASPSDSALSTRFALDGTRGVPVLDLLIVAPIDDLLIVAPVTDLLVVAPVVGSVAVGACSLLWAVTAIIAGKTALLAAPFGGFLLATLLFVAAAALDRRSNAHRATTVDN